MFNWQPTYNLWNYRRVHISSDEVFSKILKKPSIVQKKIIPHMKAEVIFIEKNIFCFMKKKFKMAIIAQTIFVFLDLNWIFLVFDYNDKSKYETMGVIFVKHVQCQVALTALICQIKTNHAVRAKARWRCLTISRGLIFYL